MRKLVTKIAMTGATIGVVLAVGGPAAAAQHGATTSTTAGVSTMADYKYVGWFWTKSACDQRGAAYQVRGQAYTWDCSRSAALVTWDLYILTD